MYWKFPSSFLGGSQEQQTQSNLQDISTTSGYPGTPNSSHPSTTISSSSTITHDRIVDRLGKPSPTEAAGIISQLKDKSVDELRKLLSDKDAYEAFFNSLDEVKNQNILHDELRNETLQVARENLEKEPQILELKNQCSIIRTTELAAAQEKLDELERKKEETLRCYSPASLLQKLHNAVDKTEEESELLQKQLLKNEIDVAAFVQKYKKLRTLYHRRSLVHLAARTSF